MSEQERSLRRALEIRRRLLKDCVEGAGRLPESVFDAFDYLMSHIHEQNRRILELEEGMERLGPIIGHRKRGRDE